MINKVLVIAPHPDDEINLAGQMIVELNQLGVEIFVAYTTNGDAEPRIGNKRIQEAINANSILGIKEDHVIFLGYPNEWSGTKHIYNAPENEELISKLGKTKTNSIPTHPEFCYERKGVHHTFTRKNFKDDFSELVESIKPDLLIAPEFDSHPDHRAASLFFDEVMGELLKKDKNYRPIIFKKYIHEGVWYGPKDYYCEPMVPTLTEGPRKYSGGIHDLDSPSFRWDDRLSFDVDDITKTPLLRDNVMYKAAKKHKVTTAWYEMQRVINADMVYWLRHTKNNILQADIEVSSGDKRYLNDYLYYNTRNVYEIKEPFKNSECYCWQPLKEDLNKEIVIKFREKTPIDKIIIYEDCNTENHIYQLEIIIDDIICRKTELMNDGSKTVINFQGISPKFIKIKILKYRGTPGISEIEAYSDTKLIESMGNIIMYHERLGSRKTTIAQYVERTSLMCKFFFSFKLKYEFTQGIIKIKSKKAEQNE